MKIFQHYFEKFGEYSNVVFSLCLVSTLLNIGFGVMIPYLPTFAEKIGASPTEIGYIMSSFMIGRAISASIAGKVSDVRGRKPLVFLGIVLFGFFTSLISISFHWIMILILRFCQGVAAGIAWPTAEALLVDSVSPKYRGEAMGVYVSTLNLGFFLGPLIGGILFFGAESISKELAYALPFLATGIFSILSAFLAKKSLRDVYVKKRKVKEEKFKVPKKIQKDIYIFYSISTFNGFALGLLIPIFALYFINVLGQKEYLVGFIIGMGGAFTVFLNPITGKYSDMFGKKPLIFLGFLATGGAGILFGLVRTFFGVSLLFMLRSLALSLYFPAYRALQANIIPPKVRGREMGRIQSFFNLGAVLGPIAGTYLYQMYYHEKFLIFGFEYLGAAVPFGAISLLMFLSSFMILWVKSEKNIESDL